MSATYVRYLQACNDVAMQWIRIILLNIACTMCKTDFSRNKMALPYEVVISSDSTGQMWNCCIWNPLSDTTSIHYKGSGSKLRSLCLLSGQYIISADSNKPLLNMWEVQRRVSIGTSLAKVFVPILHDALTLWEHPRLSQPGGILPRSANNMLSKEFSTLLEASVRRISPGIYF